jgi:hypothetical protein
MALSEADNRRNADGYNSFLPVQIPDGRHLFIRHDMKELRRIPGFSTTTPLAEYSGLQ